MGAPGGGVVSLVELCREASPAAFGGRAGKKGGRNGEKCVYSICLLFPLFLCIFTNTKKDNSFVHIFMYTQKKKKMYMSSYIPQTKPAICVHMFMYVF